MTARGSRLAMIMVGLAMLFFTISGSGCSKDNTRKKSLTVSGSTTVLPVIQTAAESYTALHKDVNISVMGGGSGVGIAALIDGRVDIANASRPIKDREVELAREKGVNPVEFTIANDGIGVVVHKDNPVNELDIATVKQLYTGEIANWKQLNGPDLEVVVVSRDVSSGTYEVFNHLVLAEAKVKDGALMAASNKAAATIVIQTPGAIGYIGFGYLSKDLKTLKIEGALPTVETVQQGTYKLSRKLYLYTNGHPQGLTKNLIDFIRSPEGQEIVQATGYIPVN